MRNMKKSTDLLLLAVFLCASSVAQSDEAALLFAHERSELHFNYDLVEKARIREAIDNKERYREIITRQQKRKNDPPPAPPRSSKAKGNPARDLYHSEMERKHPGWKEKYNARYGSR